MRVTVLSPEVELLDQECDFVALPAVAGEVGILPRHAPMVARVGFGEMRIKTGSGTESHFIAGGYLQVRDDQIYVLTEEAVDGSSLDAAEIEQELSAARELPRGEGRDQAVRRALAKQKIQRKS